MLIERSRPGSQGRQASLDGLRGIAILLVLADHWFRFRQGWIGVDLFFVLSGFLITRILWDEKGLEQFWKLFYIRRATRILPPLLLLITAVAAAHLQPWHVMVPLLLASIATVANVAAVHHTNIMYSCGLAILWSLSVEEHFYLVWPVQVRRLSLKTLSIILILILFIEPVVRVIATMSGAPWQFTYCLTPFRIDGLALGSLLALSLTSPQVAVRVEKMAPIATLITMTCIAGCFFMLDQKTHTLFCSSVGFSLLAVWSASIVAYLFTSRGTILDRALSFPPLAWLGRISYGLYLYHLLISELIQRAAERHGLARHIGRVNLVAFAVAVFVAWLSSFGENRIQAWGRSKARMMRSETQLVTERPKRGMRGPIQISSRMPNG